MICQTLKHWGKEMFQLWFLVDNTCLVWKFCTRIHIMRHNFEVKINNLTKLNRMQTWHLCEFQWKSFNILLFFKTFPKLLKTINKFLKVSTLIIKCLELRMIINAHMTRCNTAAGNRNTANFYCYLLYILIKLYLLNKMKTELEIEWQWKKIDIH